MSTTTSKARNSERVAARRTARLALAAKVVDLRAWRRARAEAARKHAAESRAARNTQPRGVDRVPTRLLVGPTEPTVVTLGELGTYRGVEANHADRRRMGQRGKPRRRRAREMPGAEQRRIDRRRREWMEAND